MPLLFEMLTDLLTLCGEVMIKLCYLPMHDPTIHNRKMKNSCINYRINYADKSHDIERKICKCNTQKPGFLGEENKSLTKEIHFLKTAVFSCDVF